MLVGKQNVSFGKALLIIPDTIKLYQTGGKIPDGYLAGPRLLLGYVVLALVVVSVLALGRRIPPVMVGIVLLATAALFPPRPFLLPGIRFASRCARCPKPRGPPGAGIFDRLAIHGGHRRAVGICVSLAAAFSIAQIAAGQPAPAPILGQLGTSGVVGTRLIVAPRWLGADLVADRVRGDHRLLRAQTGSLSRLPHVAVTMGWLERIARMPLSAPPHGHPSR